MTKPEKKALMPALRFPEFQGVEEWTIEPLEKVYAFKTTNSLSRDKLNYENGTVRNIHYGDIHTKFPTLFDIKKEDVPYINPDESLEKIKPESFCIEGDLVIADASEDMNDIGKSIELINLNGERLLSGLHTLLARQVKNKLVIGFGGYLFKSTHIRKQIQKEAQGTKVLGISVGRLSSIIVAYPNDKKEQQKIADCLSSIDDLITAQTQKLAALKAHKKGLMQQLFPAEGETVPKLRFPEFRDGGEWRRLKLVDVAEFIDSLHETPTQYVESGYPMIRVADVKDSGLDLANCLKVTEDVYIQFVKRYKPKKGDIIFSRVGSCGESVLIDFEEKICLGQNTVLIKAKESSVYLFFYLKSKLIRNQVNNKVVGSSHKTLSLKDAKNFEVFIPSETEQQKIADCLSSVDDLITAQGEKIEALKSHKKGLMQQLFPRMDEDNHPPPAAYPSRGGELRDEPFPSSGGVDSEAGRGGSPPTTGRGD
jgi:type I restriction enzyme S subunit